MCFISITTRPDVENKLRCLTAEEDCEINREEGNITWRSKGETFCSCSHSYCEFLFHFASFVWFCSQKHKREAADRWTDAVWQKQWGNVVALTSSFHSCRRKNRTVNIERNCSLLLISCSVLQMRLIHRQMYQRQWEWTHMTSDVQHLPSKGIADLHITWPKHVARLKGKRAVLPRRDTYLQKNQGSTRMSPKC